MILDRKAIKTVVGQLTIFDGGTTFQIGSLQISNLTTYWLQVQDSLVPPNTVNQVISFNPPVLRVTVRKIPPPGSTILVGTEGFVDIVFFNDVRADIPGTVIGANVTMPVQTSFGAGAGVAAADGGGINVGSPLSAVASIPMFYGEGAGGNGNWAYVAQRGVIIRRAAKVAVAINTQTNLIALTGQAAEYKRVMYVVASVDTAGFLEIGDDNWGLFSAFIAAFVAANTPIVLNIPNGYLTFATNIIGRLSVAGNIGIAVGLAFN